MPLVIQLFDTRGNENEHSEAFFLHVLTLVDRRRKIKISILRKQPITYWIYYYSNAKYLRGGGLQSRKSKYEFLRSNTDIPELLALYFTLYKYYIKHVLSFSE